MPCKYLILIGASMLALSNPALAQSQPGPAVNGGLSGDDIVAAQTAEASTGDIIVTAQFRGQRVQDTPLAITAIGAAQIEAKGLTRITDITNSAPNVVMVPSGSVYGPAATLFIRGVGQLDSSFALDPGVGLYVDDVYRGITFGSLIDLLDLERVEILRGPQGTLAGKNAIGGAVKLFSKLPDGKGGGYLEATTGSYNRLDVKGAADFTLVPDALFVRVSAVTRHRDGFLTLLDYNCTHPNSAKVPTSTATGGDCKAGAEGGQNYTAARVALRWTASDRVEVNLSASRLVDDSAPPPTKLMSLTVNPLNTPGFTGAEFLTGPTDYSSYTNYQVQSFTDPAIYAGRPGAGTHPAMTFPANNRIRAWDIAGTVDVKIGDSVILKSITAYQYTDGRYTADNDVSPFGISTSVFGLRYKQFTQEARLSGVALEDVEWTVGGYYFNGKGYLTGTNIIQPGLNAETVNGADDYIPTISKSGFGQIIWHIADRLNVTAGIRYTDDEKSYSFRRTNLYLPGQPTYTSASLINGLFSVYKGSKWDYRANIDYKIIDDVLVYAQFSTGYRGGGVNPRPFVIEQALPFSPETLAAYEIGLKSDLLGRRLRLNLSAFINNYKDIVLTNTAPTIVNGVVISTGNATPVNAGDGRFKGIEIEATLRPIDGLTIDGNLSYLDFNFTRIGAAGATIAGITLNSIAPYVAKWKAAAGIQYTADLGSAGSLSPRLDVAYQSSFFTNVNNNPGTLTPGYTIFNGHVSWASEGRVWQLTAAVTNIFDKFYFYNRFFGPVGVTSGQPAPPREFSLSLRRNF